MPYHGDARDDMTADKLFAISCDSFHAFDFACYIAHALPQRFE